jgi:hypothetical protein
MAYHPQGVRLDGHLLRGGAATRTVDHCTSPPFVPDNRTGTPCATQGFGRALVGHQPARRTSLASNGSVPRRGGRSRRGCSCHPVAPRLQGPNFGATTTRQAPRRPTLCVDHAGTTPIRLAGTRIPHLRVMGRLQGRVRHCGRAGGDAPHRPQPLSPRLVSGRPIVRGGHRGRGLRQQLDRLVEHRVLVRAGVRRRRHGDVGDDPDVVDPMLLRGQPLRDRQLQGRAVL